MHINKITILVRDVDAAIRFYRDALGLKLIEDSLMSGSKRIVRLATSDSARRSILPIPNKGMNLWSVVKREIVCSCS